MRVGFLARKSARPGAGRHTVPCNRRGARGRVNEQIAGLWTGAPRKLKTVNQWRIRRVPTSVRHRLTAHARGQPEPNVLSFVHCAGSPGTLPASTAVSTYFGAIAGIVTGFLVRAARACRNPAWWSCSVSVWCCCACSRVTRAPRLRRMPMPATRQWEWLVRSDCGNTDALRPGLFARPSQQAQCFSRSAAGLLAPTCLHKVSTKLTTERSSGGQEVSKYLYNQRFV